jgi:hypothetical protein
MRYDYKNSIAQNENQNTSTPRHALHLFAFSHFFTLSLCYSVTLLLLRHFAISPPEEWQISAYLGRVYIGLAFS